MLGSVSLTLLELWEVLNHSLHVLNRIELGLTLLGVEELFDERLNLVGEIPEIVVQDASFLDNCGVAIIVWLINLLVVSEREIMIN